MCRMSALAATAAVLALAVASATSAWAKGPDKPAPAAAQPSAPHKAGPEERAQAQRLDPLARAAFWAREAELDPRDIEAAVDLSQALRALGRYDEALAATDKLLVALPDTPEVLLESARAQIGRGQGFYAIAPARKAQELNPRDWRAPSLLGVAYEQAGRDEEALAAHRQAVALAPANPAAITNLALYLAAHGQGAEGERLMRQAVALPGAGMAVRQNLALVVGLQGRLDEAEKLLRADLPPDQVANDLAYLRAATAPGDEKATPSATTRSWDAVRGGGR